MRVLGLALCGSVLCGSVLSGCGSEAAPRLGGVAAEVEGQTITLDDVEVATDALCTSNAATGDTRYTRPRSQMADDVLGALVQAAIAEELGIGAEAQNTVDIDQVPGYADLNNDEQRELHEFLDADARLRTALQELSDGDAATSEEAAQAGLDALAERAVEADVDVTINPRFELSYEDGSLSGTTGLSTPVSETATQGEQRSAQYLGSLPDAQLCGARPGSSSAAG